MHEIRMLPRLEQALRKLERKDPVRREAALKKMAEISMSDPHRYKNLQYDLKHYKRCISTMISFSSS